MRNIASRVVGCVLIFASIYYLYLNFPARQQYSAILENLTNAPFSVASMLGLYILALMVQSYCWALLCKQNVNLDFRASFVFQSRTQIYRYLPSGVLHYLARQKFAQENGIRQGEMVKLSLIELLLQLLAASIISVSFILLSIEHIRGLLIQELEGNLLLFLVILMCVALPLLVLIKVRLYRERLNKLLSSTFFTAAFLATSIYFLLNGLILAMIFSQFVDESPNVIKLGSLVMAYSLAWLVGLAAPLAPAGLGVRDAVLVSLMLLLSLPNVALVVLVHRLIQLIGDATYAAIFYFVPQHSTRGLF